MAAHPRQHPGLGRRGAAGQGDSGPTAERARVPDPPAWALHLGAGPCRGEPPTGDSGVSVRSDGAKARHYMATVRIPDENRTLTDQDQVTRYLATLGIDYERWPGVQRVPQQAAPEEVLAAYAPEIEQRKARGGYVTADVIERTAQTPN